MMDLPPTLLAGWSAIHAAGSDQAGGKAFTLARLARYGFPVPDGLVLTVDAMPQDRCVTGGLIADLTRALLILGWQNQPLAVRSSAPQEDGVRTSFAGIHRSCLNVVGVPALVQAIESVWQSAISPAALAYRQRHGLVQDHPPMAVLIMPLLPAVAGGIGFTCDPATGRDDRLILQAGRGLGEILVGGQEAGDIITLAEDVMDSRLTLLRYQPGRQGQQVQPQTGGGTATVPVPADQVDQPVLTQDQALELGARLQCAALALDLARPAYDFEWVWDGARFWIVQARPVTAQARCTYDGLQDQPDLWSRGNSRDVMPAPMAAIDWTSTRRLVNLILEQGYKLAGFALHPGAQRAGLFHGRLYLNVSLLQWEAGQGLGIAPSVFNRLMGGNQPEIAQPPAGLRGRLGQVGRLLRFLRKAPALQRRGLQEIADAPARAARWRATPLPDQNADILALIGEWCRAVRSSQGLHFLQGSGGAGLMMLVDRIDKILPGQGYGLAAALLAGVDPSVTAQMGYDLVRLAHRVVADPATRRWLEQRDRTGSGPALAGLPDDSPLHAGLAEFLDQYGHRGIYETYSTNPRYREAPGYLLDQLLDLAQTDLDALRQRQIHLAAEARRQVRAALPWWRRPWLDRMVRTANRESNLREAARSCLIRYLEPQRALLLHFGQRLATQGDLTRAEDAFHLTHQDLHGVLAGWLGGAGLAQLAIDRREIMATQAQTDPPDIIAWPDDLPVPMAAAPAKARPSAAGFHGIAASGGWVRGTVRRVMSPSEGIRLLPGEILLAPSTDPAWTPLLLKAGGVVLETGGYLSHGAIVAREFGLPAVVNIPGILAALKDGDEIEVDGRLGRVIKLSAD